MTPITLEASDALLAYLCDNYHAVHNGTALAVVDVLQDLMHLCEMTGVDFDRAVRAARSRSAVNLPGAGAGE